MILFVVEKSISAMETRRVSRFRARVIHQQVTSTVQCENKENANPVLGNELEISGQDRNVLVRCQPRWPLRVPLRDITHLFPGNAASSEDGIDTSPLVLHGLGYGQEMGPSQNSRKRRQLEPASETTTVRRVLRKFR